MPTNIAIIHTRDFIRAKADGALNLEASRKLLVDVVSAIRTAGEHNALIDTRAAAPTGLPSTDLWTLGVAAGTQPALARGRVALLIPLDSKEDPEFFESVARLEAANVRAFPILKARSHGIIMREQSDV